MTVGEPLPQPEIAPWSRCTRALKAELTEQEVRILALVTQGKTNREIAETLFLGEGTVRNYVSRILSKLGVSNRAEAAAYAVKHNIQQVVSEG